MVKEIKLVLCGDGGVGKSAIVIRFIQNTFLAVNDPTIEDTYRKIHNVNGEDTFLDILDTAGAEEFSVMRTQYMRTGEGFILVYSAIDSFGFNELTKFAYQIFEVKENFRTPLIFVATKTDLPNRRVTLQEGEKLASHYGAKHIEVSSANGLNVDNLFSEISREVIKSQTIKSWKENFPSLMVFAGDQSQMMVELARKITNTQIDNNAFEPKYLTSN